MLTLSFKNGNQGLEVTRKNSLIDGQDPRYELTITKTGRRRHNNQAEWEDDIITTSLTLSHEEFRDLINGMDKIS